MKKICGYILPIMIFLALSGYSDSISQTSSNENIDADIIIGSKDEQENTINTETETEEVSYDIGSDISVLSIKTKNQSDALDFVTKPVASHVAEDIASWTPNYQMPPAPYYEDCTITLTDTDDNIVLNSVDAMVKVRGNWTTTYEFNLLRHFYLIFRYGKYCIAVT